MPELAAIAKSPPPPRRLILATACLGAFLATLDTSIVNIALPQMAREFQSSLTQISWVMQVYLLANVAFLLSTGRLGDMLPPGRLFLAGLTVFALGSALCGFSPGLAWMVASRAFQGVGASLMLGVAPKLITVTFREGERGLPLGLFSTAFATGISVGAPLGGFITAYWGWPYIFFIKLPVCLLALLVGLRPLESLAAAQRWERRAFDLGGSLCLALTLAGFILALTWARDSGWGSPWTLIALAVAGGAGAALWWAERRHPQPLLHPDLWRRWPFVAGALAVLLTFTPVMGTFFLLPFFLDQIYHYLPQQAGLLLAVVSFTNALVSPLGGYLADRLSNLLILRIGSLLILAGLISLQFTTLATTTMELVWRFALLGLGFGLFQAPNLNEVLKGVGQEFMGLAASANAVLKNLGALLGITLMLLAFAWFNQHQVCLKAGTCLDLTPFQRAFALAAVIAVANLLLNLLPRKPQRG
jgi:EmrB/QacA subfamily drug resistance transporter